MLSSPKFPRLHTTKKLQELGYVERTDKLDSHMDSELADDALQYLKRQHAFKVLTDQYNSHTNDIGMAFNEHDRLKNYSEPLKGRPR